MMGGRNRAAMFADVLGKGFCCVEETHPKPALPCFLRVLEKASTGQKVEIQPLGS